MRILIDSLASLGIATVTALPVDNIAEWVDVAKTFGVVGAILLYFITRDWLRYQADQKEKIAMSKKIDCLQETITTGYLQEIRSNQAIIIKAERTHKILIETYEPTSSKMHDHQVQIDDDSTREIRKKG